MAKQLTKAAPEVSKILFENDRVRVMEITVKKGSKMGMHTHPAYFAYTVTEIDYISKPQGGKAVKRKLAKNSVDWHDGETHEAEFLNSGRAIVVELK